MPLEFAVVRCWLRTMNLPREKRDKPTREAWKAGIMAKAKSGSTEASKAGDGGQKLGCRLGADEANLLGSLEYLLGGSAGAIVVQGLIALCDTLPKSQQEAIATMMRARNSSLAKLKRSCGHVVTESPVEEPDQGRAGGLLPDDRLAAFSRIHQRATSPVDAALESL